MFTAFLWDADPAIFSLFGREIRWYGLLFALSFFIGRSIMYHMYRRDGKPAHTIESLLLYTFVSTVIGARIGHVLFYDPGYYFAHPLEILYIHKGGLASHGAAIGILVGTALFCRKKKQSYLWVLDRAIIVIALGGMCIRIGNFMNAEIYGKPTDHAKGVVFVRQAKAYLRQALGAAEVSIHATERTASSLQPLRVQIRYDRVPVALAQVKSFVAKKMPHILAHPYARDHLRVDSLQIHAYQDQTHTYLEFPAEGVARHPTQLYEALFYLLLFALLYLLWRHRRLPEGFLLSLFLILLWGFRLGIEFVKVPQEEFSHASRLNVGQWLSIPFLGLGLGLMFVLWHRHKKKAQDTT